MVDILVLGATGFTGRLITRYLYSHPQRSSFSLALGVRSKSKGEALKRTLGLDDSVQLVQVDVTRYEDVEKAVKDAKVVINAVGPYWRWGTNVVRACAVHGKRYVDLSGEPHFARRIIDLYDYLATKTGAIIVPSCGFDSLPADITVYLSNQTLKRKLGPEVELGLSQTFYDVYLPGASGGSTATLLSTLSEAPRVRVDEAHRDYALSPIRGAPSPGFRLATRVPFSSPAKYAGMFVMGPSNRSIVQRSFGLNQFALTAANALYGERRVRETEERLRPLAYGPHFRYAEYIVPRSGSFFAAALMSTLLAAAFSLMLVAPVRWLVSKFFPQPGEGASDKAMEKGYLNATNYTVTATSPETWAKTVMRVDGDPGYLRTAAMISECALGLLLEDESLPYTARSGGVLTPATALGDVIVRRLQATGKFAFESEIVDGVEESRKGR